MKASAFKSGGPRTNSSLPALFYSISLKEKLRSSTTLKAVSFLSCNKLYLFLYPSPSVSQFLTRDGNQNIFPPPGFKSKADLRIHALSLSEWNYEESSYSGPICNQSIKPHCRKCQSWRRLDELRLSTRASLSYYPNRLFESWQAQLEYKKDFSLSDFASEKEPPSLKIEDIQYKYFLKIKWS